MAAIEVESANEAVGNHLQQLRDKYTSSLNFDSLYMPILFRDSVRVDPLTGEIKVFETVVDLHVRDFIERELGSSVERIAAFLCFRKNHITQLELDYCLRTLMKQPSLPAFLETHPDLLELISD